MKKAAVFEKTYRDYLAQVGEVDLLSRAASLGGEASGSGLILHFYRKPYRVSAEGVTDAEGKTANFAVSVVLCRYILQCPTGIPDSGGWVTYREFREAGPLMSYFTANTHKIIETTFAGDIPALKKASESLGGIPYDDGSSHDISIKFDFLPKIPVLLRFNDRDTEFPAQCVILFRQSAEQYLDMECLSIGGTFLSGILIGKSR